MFDRASFWSPVPAWPLASIEHAGVRIRPAPSPALMCLVSGDLSRFLEERGLRRCLGPRDTCDGRLYALRLAPDCLLFVGSDPFPGFDGATGWSSDRTAVSDVSDGFLCFDLTGERAGDVMRMGALYDFDAPAGRGDESAVMLFAGTRVAVVRLETGWRLHVERPVAAPLWHWLETANECRRN